MQKQTSLALLEAKETKLRSRKVVFNLFGGYHDFAYARPAGNLLVKNFLHCRYVKCAVEFVVGSDWFWCPDCFSFSMVSLCFGLDRSMSTYSNPFLAALRRVCCRSDLSSREVSLFRFEVYWWRLREFLCLQKDLIGLGKFRSSQALLRLGRLWLVSASQLVLMLLCCFLGESKRRFSESLFNHRFFRHRYAEVSSSLRR